MNKTLLFIFFLFIVKSSVAQYPDRVVDSLTGVLKTAKEDTATVNTLNLLAKRLWLMSDYAKATDYANKTLSLAEKIEFKKGIAEAYNKIGLIYYDQGNYPDALKNQFASLKVSEEIGYKQGIVKAWGNIGNNYLQLGNYPEALKNYLTVLKMSEESRNEKSMTIAYNNIGNIYEHEANYPEALKNYQSALKTAEKINDKNDLLNAYGNIAIIYMDQGHYSEAFKNYSTVLKIAEEVGDKEGIASSFMNIGELYQRMNKFPESKEYLDKALALYEDIGSKEGLMDCYGKLSELDNASKDFKGAYQYHLLYSKMKDSLFNIGSDKQISQLKIQYETEKKDKEIALLNSENKIKTTDLEKQRLVKYVGFSFALLIILMTILTFNNIRIKSRARQLVKANEIRQRISRDLHDEIGSGLSRMSLISQVAMQYQGDKQKLNENLLKMKLISQQLSQQMNEMIWKVNPTYDTLESMLGYIRQYAGELLEENNIEYEINFPDELKDMKISTDFRRNIYSITKEALNNVIKHARASKLNLRFKLGKAEEFEYTIADNGCGFELDKTNLFRNGLKNLHQRAEEIGLQLNMDSGRSGTTIVLCGKIINDA